MQEGRVVRRSGPARLAQVLTAEMRNVPSDHKQAALQSLFSRVAQCVHSSEHRWVLAGVLAVDDLVDCDAIGDRGLGALR